MSGFLTVSIGSGLNGTIYGDCQVPLKRISGEPGRGVPAGEPAALSVPHGKEPPLGGALFQRDRYGRL